MVEGLNPILELKLVHAVSTENILNGSKSDFSLEDLMTALADSSGERRPVERWNPDFCGEIDIVIKSDGRWFHDGSEIKRQPLVKLFASVLRKDEDGVTYLVTPVEKLAIQVEKAHFLAVRLDAKGESEDQRLFFTTNLGDVIEASAENMIRVETHKESGEPAPFINVWGRLEATLTRPVFYELVDLAIARETTKGVQYGVWGGGEFFPLGPVEALHD